MTITLNAATPVLLLACSSCQLMLDESLDWDLEPVPRAALILDEDNGSRWRDAEAHEDLVRVGEVTFFSNISLSDNESLAEGVAEFGAEYVSFNRYIENFYLPNVYLENSYSMVGTHGVGTSTTVTQSYSGPMETGQERAGAILYARNKAVRAYEILEGWRPHRGDVQVGQVFGSDHGMFVGLSTVLGWIESGTLRPGDLPTRKDCPEVSPAQLWAGVIADAYTRVSSREEAGVLSEIELLLTGVDRRASAHEHALRRRQEDLSWKQAGRPGVVVNELAGISYIPPFGWEPGELGEPFPPLYGLVRLHPGGDILATAEIHIRGGKLVADNLREECAGYISERTNERGELVIFYYEGAHESEVHRSRWQIHAFGEGRTHGLFVTITWDPTDEATRQALLAFLDSIQLRPGPALHPAVWRSETRDASPLGF